MEAQPSEKRTILRVPLPDLDHGKALETAPRPDGFPTPEEEAQLGREEAADASAGLDASAGMDASAGADASAAPSSAASPDGGAAR